MQTGSMLHYSEFEAVLDPVFALNSAGIIEWASAASQRVFGWTPSELRGKDFSEVVICGKSAHTKCALSINPSLTLHCEFQTRSGQRIPCDVTRVQTLIDMQSPGGMLIVIRDRSDRQRLLSEAKLIRDLAVCLSEAGDVQSAYVKALHHICIATKWDYAEIWIPDSDGKSLRGVACWSQPKSQMLKFAATHSAYRFARGEGLPGRAWESGQAEWCGDVTKLPESEFWRAKAARRAGLCGAVAIPLRGLGQVSAVMVFFMAGTRAENPLLVELVQAAAASLGPLVERRQLDAELQKYRCHLEDLVDERTRSLEESQNRLRMSDRLASIGTLAAGLGHDMNNVLLPIRAHLAALKSCIVNSLQQEVHFRNISESLEYLQELADGLHYLCIDPERDSSTYSEIDLHAWWSHTGSLLANVAINHAQLSASLPRDLPHLLMSAPSLTQAVLNLVTNSVAAIRSVDPPRIGHIYLTAQVIDGGSAVTIEVKDDGAGMTDEVKRRAMDLFFTTRPRELGAGLGLSLVQRAVSGAGGSVQFRSKPGQGTTFSLTIPAVVRSDTNESQLTAKLLVPRGRARELLKGLLEGAGAAIVDDNCVEPPSVFVVAPLANHFPAAVEWRRRSSHGQLILLGRPPQKTLAPWNQLNPASILSEPLDLSLAQNVVMKTMAFIRSGEMNAA